MNNFAPKCINSALKFLKAAQINFILTMDHTCGEESGSKITSQELVGTKTELKEKLLDFNLSNAQLQMNVNVLLCPLDKFMRC